MGDLGVIGEIAKNGEHDLCDVGDPIFSLCPVWTFNNPGSKELIELKYN
jgi:hypothetical protein